MFAFRKVLFVVVVTGLVLTGCANSEATEVKITLKEFGIESSMTDFQTDVLYRFVVTNQGAAEHEIMLMPPLETGSMGTPMNMDEMDKMALAMISASDLPSGATASFNFTFTESAPSGSLELACHTPGHYEMGMKLPITVK